MSVAKGSSGKIRRSFSAFGTNDCISGDLMKIASTVFVLGALTVGCSGAGYDDDLDGVETESAAQALSRTVNLCFNLQVDYTDGAVGDYTSTTMTAYGIRVYVKNNSTGVGTWNWADAETGCVSLSMDRNATYQIRPISKVKVVGDNIVNLFNNTTDRVNFGWTAASSFDPDSASSVTYTWPANPGGSYEPKVSNIVAAAAWSLRRRYGGLSGETLVLYKQGCSGGGSCLSSDSNGGLAVYLSDGGGTKNKFQISHELGHLVAATRDEKSGSSNSGYGLYYGRTPAASSCATGLISDGATYNHAFDTEEWITSAMNEGMAHFYAAAVWNWPGESDCKWYSYYTGSTIDCEAGSKFLVNSCYGGSYPSINSGSELDWMRFWWDVHSDCDIAFGPIMDIWDSADPRTWSDSNALSRLLGAAESRLSAADYSCFQTKGRFNGVMQ